MRPLEIKNQFDLERCLFIENGVFTSEEAFAVHYIYRVLKENGVECRVIERASQNSKEVYEGLKWCDSIFFSSTFLHQNEIKGLGDLIKSIKEPKTIFGQLIGGDILDSLAYELESIWSLKEIVGFAHHSIYEIKGSRDFDLVNISMSKYVSEFESSEKERIKKNKSFERTGRRVIIKKIQASGRQWSNLKEDDVVDELDCRSIDPNPSRGVWVMGLEEPVKLLNDSGYEEWEYEDLKAFALAKEFFSRGSMLEENELLNVVSDWIKNCSGKTSESELWDWCNTLCETVNVERRGNRSYFERRLKEYKSKHVYFKER
jgi:hypothetical protein